MKKKIISFTSFIYIFFLLVLYPLISGKSYATLADIKFYSFFYISLFYCIFTGWMEISAMLRPDREGIPDKKRKSWDTKGSSALALPDILVIVYAILVLISYLNAEDKEGTLWGFDGWYMGLYTQLLLVALYFVIRRASCIDNEFMGGKRKKLLRISIVISSVPVMLIGIIQSFDTDIFGLYARDAGLYNYQGEFFTTMGQSSWYSGYLLLVLVYSLYINFTDRETDKITSVLLLFHLLLVVAAIIRLNAMAAYGGSAIALLVLIWILWTKKKQLLFLRNLIFGSILVILLLLIVFVILNSAGIFGQPVKGPAGLFCFDNMWGNQRGVIWKHTVSMYKAMPFEDKLFGVGPDNYYGALGLADESELISYMANSITVCAHNEWLNALICYGLLGGVVYLGIFAVTIYRLLTEQRDDSFRALPLMILVSYIAHDTFTYQQYYTTPVIFVILGITATFLNRKKDPDMIKS